MKLWKEFVKKAYFLFIFFFSRLYIKEGFINITKLVVEDLKNNIHVMHVICRIRVSFSIRQMYSTSWEA